MPLMLKWMNFEQIRKFIARRSVAKGQSGPNLDRLTAIIRNAGTRLPGTCLSRSLAGAMVLARFGHPSEVLIGVSMDQDFQAHAWLECAGAPITERDIAAVRWKQLTRVTIGS